jgi:ribosomal peptide maturation radical SAM protein 1
VLQTNEDRELDAETLWRVRRQAVPEFLDGVCRNIDWGQFAVVGFTSTFQQNTASLALARSLKEHFPGVTILFGGANLDGEMGPELVRAFPWIDFAVSGEADLAFPAFLSALREGQGPAHVRGLLSPERPDAPPAEMTADLQSLPTPRYDEYFERAERLGVLPSAERSSVIVPFEASRGCWWGQKHHCTFCGLNGMNMKFRQKSAERVLDELAELSRRHGVFRFNAVDNIMPMDFLNDFAPVLNREERHYEIFFELKANLSRTQIKALRDGGVSWAQPGIESLSTHSLRLMRKGIRAIQNVNFLRWARYYETDAVWNLIWGFPGETVQDIAWQTQLIPKLVHLQPPEGVSRIVLDRFSPNYFDRERFPVRSLEPELSLSYVYPDRVNLRRLAYTFDHEFADELPASAYQPLRQAAELWQDAWDDDFQPTLTFRSSPGVLIIQDQRRRGGGLLYRFDDPLAGIYTAISDAPLSAAALREHLDLPWKADDISEALDLFADKGLVMREDDLFLALAIPFRV